MLIDERDLPFIANRAHTEFTYLGDTSENAHLGIRGMDYVPHDDILPYVSQDNAPIQHILFERLLMPASRSNSDHTHFVAQPTLIEFQEKNHPWLELSDVYKETTEDIRVTVIPFYMGYKRPNHDNQSANIHWVSTMYFF